MELKIILNLIKQNKFLEAKKNLLDLVNNKVKIINNIPHPDENLKNIYFTLSQVCTQLNELQDSKKFLINHLNLNKNDCEALFNLANLHLKSREIEKAEMYYKKILKIDENYLPAIVNLANLYEGLGKINEAKKYYLNAKTLQPENLKFYYNLIRLNPDFINDEIINLIKILEKSQKILEKDKFIANYILSKNFEKKKNLKKEIYYLERAHKSFLKYNVNKQSQNYWINIIPNYFNKFKFKNSSKKIFKNLNPIFIIGLPRSGSTITEMILSTSKTNKYTIGESNLINYNLIKLYYEKFLNLNEKENLELDINLIEQKLHLGLKNLGVNTNNKCILIDKSLENFFYVDLIIEIFPNAKFVVTQRNDVDNVIGIYKKMLLDISWAHSIFDIIKYIDNFKYIINYFNNKYPEKFFSVDLDDLQNCNDDKILSLFRFCNLSFNEKYSKFQNINQFVNNASNIQIRNRFYKFEKDKYKDYKKLLKEHANMFSWINFDN